ncbi:Cytochrome b6-f complex iron-sulfur subunit [Gimesia panareensis]|uniref:Cytochrome b6-f complex iron-sulfur subunit n=1 Tax=Gimesia panareensis TaxID=2527978 RepID=A0A518FK51_9PLAN|nr:Rieske (2Fe-2S) protein [Gimesia panareensis]QDT27156.1 Cytochrome b6-f complex iron-sulfur subunit [Gimesia panareensis]QDV16721.1 Cytochrome b6-f complex iron-sulfur subunit [Gimesia panareensis]
MRRRKFLKYCSGILGSVYATILAVPALGFLFSTLKRGQQKERTYRLTRLDDLEPGVPQRFTIIDQRVDAWTKYPAGPIGSVWITKGQDGAVTAFSSTCPHLGCVVDYVPGDEEFFCPCHAASFQTDGAVVGGPAPRGMDELKTSLKKVRGEQWVEVEYQKFETGISEKKAIG